MQLTVDKTTGVKLWRRLTASSRLARGSRCIVARLGQGAGLGAGRAERVSIVMSAITALRRRRADQTKGAARVALRNGRARRGDDRIGGLHKHSRPLSIRRSGLILASHRLETIVRTYGELLWAVVLERGRPRDAIDSLAGWSAILGCSSRPAVAVSKRLVQELKGHLVKASSLGLCLPSGGNGVGAGLGQFAVDGVLAGVDVGAMLHRISKGIVMGGVARVALDDTAASIMMGGVTIEAAAQGAGIVAMDAILHGIKVPLRSTARAVLGHMVVIRNALSTAATLSDVAAQVALGVAAGCVGRSASAEVVLQGASTAIAIKGMAACGSQDRIVIRDIIGELDSKLR